MEQLKQLLTAAGIAYKENEPLAAHCTFKIGGPARLFVQPIDHAQLCRTVALCKAQGVRYYLLGNGSNILFADEGYDGAVLDISSMQDAVEVHGTQLTAGAGVRLSALCKTALEHGLTGLEFAYGIPGTVGGAVYMNAGAYGGEMKDVLTTVQYLTAEGEVKEAAAAELDLRYRHSIFEENGGCILSAQFALTPGEPEAIRAKMDELMAKRLDKQPLDKPSAGSTFKRPVGAFAAALIDQCGLRGYRHGGAAVSEKHCGFVVNLGGATCADVLALCEEVRTIVKEKTGNDPLEMFEKALENIMPSLEVKARRVGGSTYQVPLEVRPERRETLGLRWLTTYARARSERTMRERLAGEIMDAVNGNGNACKKREDTHKMAEANKAFAHYRF